MKDKDNLREIKELYRGYVDATNVLKAAQVESEEVRKSIPAIEGSPNLIVQDIELHRERRIRLIANHAGDEEVLELDNKIRELNLDLEKQRDIIAGVKLRYNHFLNKIIPQAIQARNEQERQCYQAVIGAIFAQIPRDIKELILQASVVARHHGLSSGGHKQFLVDIFPEPSSLEEQAGILEELKKIYGIDF